MTTERKKIEIEVIETDESRFYLFLGHGGLKGDDCKIFFDIEDAKKHRDEHPFPGKLSKCLYIEEIN